MSVHIFPGGNKKTPDNGTKEPPMPPMELTERVAKIEAKLDSVLPTLATKGDVMATMADLHKELNSQTWKLVTFTTGFGAALVAAVYFIAKHTS